MRGGSDDFWGFAGEDLICGGSGNDHILLVEASMTSMRVPVETSWSQTFIAQDRFYGGTGADDIWAGVGRKSFSAGTAMTPFGREEAPMNCTDGPATTS
jgi:Ca2+-binding RTX toxin-like protein